MGEAGSHDTMDDRAYPLVAFLFAVLVSLSPAVGAAQERAEDIESTRGMAMGTGARASAASTSAAAYNAAGLPQGRLYHLEGLVGYDAAYGRWSFGATAVDSMSNKLAAGLSIRAIMGDGERGHSGLDGRLGLGLPLSDAFAIGLAGRYLSLSRDGQGAAGETDGQTLAKGFTLDASIAVQPAAGLRLAGLGYNLIDMDSPLAPRLIGGGASFSTAEVFTLGADCLVDLSTFDQAELIVGGGAEYLAAGRVPIRLGYEYDSGRHTHSVTGGVGYVDQQVGIDVALDQQVRGGTETRLLLAFRYFVR